MRFDENPGFRGLEADGIYFCGLQKTASHLFRLDPGRPEDWRITGPDDFMGGSFSFSRDGKQVAF